MDKVAKLNQAFKDMFKTMSGDPIVLISVEVVSVEGDTCTIEYNGVNIDGVRLRPTGSEIETKLLITPRVGSFVLIGSQSGDFRDCNVLLVEEPEKIEITAKKLNLVIDVPAGKITLNKGELGGLVNIQPLTDNLKSIADFAKAINSALPNAFMAVGAGTAANGALGAQSYSGAMVGSAIIIKDMEDTNVKH